MGRTVACVTAMRSLDVKPSKTRVRTLPRMSCSVAALGGADLTFVIPNADAAFEIASRMEDGVAVGLTAWKSFCTTAATSVPRMVPFAIASIVQSELNLEI
jgi:hypothetical protein